MNVGMNFPADERKTYQSPGMIMLMLVLLLNLSTAFAQDDLAAELNQMMPKEREYVSATFKGPRLVNLHTVETIGRRTLEFRIAHRFGDIASGVNNLWGLDGGATIQFHFDYGLTDRLTIGLGRASYSKMYDGLVKYNLLRQTKDNGIPISLTGLGSVNAFSGPGFEPYKKFSNRLVYLAQVSVARKFSSKLSIQVSPIFIHYNLARNIGDKNDIFAIGLSGRYKFTRRTAVTGEYIYRINKYSADFSSYHDALSIGLDLETGGHVFQVFVTNAIAINEVMVVPYTQSEWSKKQVRLGFNISRIFGGKKHKPQNAG